SADPSGPDFCLIFVPLAGYDVPEILLKQFSRSVSWSLTGDSFTYMMSNSEFWTAMVGPLLSTKPA
ncbi:hypothetical protein, partial [Marinicauda algicola]|uniref:hypothetical protein n=1 Tax=Marinicauda algicola TaxID=2029849 RepID=UPI001A7E6F3A